MDAELLDPTNLTPGWHITIMVTGMMGTYTALVTSAKDRYGWCEVVVEKPIESVLCGVTLRCEDYIPMEYIT